MHRSPRCRLFAVSGLAAAGVALSGCLYAQIPAATATSPGMTIVPTGDWQELPACGVPGTIPWVLVDDFPVAELTGAQLSADCGDIWTGDADGDAFAGIMVDPATQEQIDALGAALAASGYELLVDDFDPAAPSGEAYWGARDYYLDGEYDGDFTRAALEIYPSPETDGAWTVYFDFEAPSTRALAE